MAKQNFLAGGFYGKLGAMVGQRWKNKRTIRTYVIPHNPNTPEQRKNRNGFAGAVQFASPWAPVRRRRQTLLRG